MAFEAVVLDLVDEPDTPLVLSADVPLDEMLTSDHRQRDRDAGPAVRGGDEGPHVPEFGVQLVVALQVCR